MIPFIDLKPYVELARNAYVRGTQGSRFLDDVEDTLDDCAFINSPAVEQFEAALAKYLDVPHVVACANGTDALIMALMARGIGPGCRVAIPNLTFWATYEAVRAVGAEAIVIDIDPATLQMSLERFTEYVTKMRASNRYAIHAAILVHLFGWASPDTCAFRTFCCENGIALIEDAAQAIGVCVNGVPVLKGADTGTLSFHPAKVLGGIMDGGAVTVSDEAFAVELRSIRNHGRGLRHYVHERAGLNSRMSTLQAKWLTRALPTLGHVIENRIATLNAYERFGVKLRMPPDGTTPNGYLAIVSCLHPNDVASELKAKGIETARIYPCPISKQPGFVEAPHQWYEWEAHRFCQTVLNLPLYYGMREDDVKTVAEAYLEATR